jgi:hypothetical protein
MYYILPLTPEHVSLTMMPTLVFQTSFPASGQFITRWDGVVVVVVFEHLTSANGVLEVGGRVDGLYQATKGSQESQESQGRQRRQEEDIPQSQRGSYEE